MAVSGAPVTLWFNYDTGYTERYLGLVEGEGEVSGRGEVSGEGEASRSGKRGQVGVRREERIESYCMVLVYSYWGTGTASPYWGCFDKGLV